MLALSLAGASVRVLREYERGVVFRFGRLVAQKGPGLVLLVPIADRMVRVTLRTITHTIQPQDVITRDNVPARVDAVAYFRVVDAVHALVVVRVGHDFPIKAAMPRPWSSAPTDATCSSPDHRRRRRRRERRCEDGAAPIPGCNSSIRSSKYFWVWPNRGSIVDLPIAVSDTESVGGTRRKCPGSSSRTPVKGVLPFKQNWKVR